jgi:hypothetical protein
MSKHKNKKRTSGSEKRRDYIGGRYGRGHAYGNPDTEFGVDARAYGHYRSNDRLNNNEYDYRQEGYAGRNASDYSNRAYSDSYYYNPSDYDRGGYRSNAYSDNNNNYGDRDYDRNYSKGGDTRYSPNYSSRNDYFNTPRSRDYYGSYPSYGQSSPDYYERNGNRNQWSGYDERDSRRQDSAQNRFVNYGSNRNNSTSYDYDYDRGYDERNDGQEYYRERPNIRDRRY